MTTADVLALTNQLPETCFSARVSKESQRACFKDGEKPVGRDGIFRLWWQQCMSQLLEQNTERFGINLFSRTDSLILVERSI